MPLERIGTIDTNTIGQWVHQCLSVVGSMIIVVQQSFIRKGFGTFKATITFLAFFGNSIGRFFRLLQHGQCQLGRFGGILSAVGTNANLTAATGMTRLFAKGTNPTAKPIGDHKGLGRPKMNPTPGSGTFAEPGIYVNFVWCQTKTSLQGGIDMLKANKGGSR